MSCGYECAYCLHDRKTLFVSAVDGARVFHNPERITIQRSLHTPLVAEYISWELVAGSFYAYLKKFPYLDAEWRFSFDRPRAIWQVIIECTTTDKTLFDAFCNNRIPAEPPEGCERETFTINLNDWPCDKRKEKKLMPMTYSESMNFMMVEEASFPLEDEVMNVPVETAAASMAKEWEEQESNERLMKLLKECKADAANTRSGYATQRRTDEVKNTIIEVAASTIAEEWKERELNDRFMKMLNAYDPDAAKKAKKKKKREKYRQRKREKKLLFAESPRTYFSSSSGV